MGVWKEYKSYKIWRALSANGFSSEYYGNDCAPYKGLDGGTYTQIAYNFGWGLGSGLSNRQILNNLTPIATEDLLEDYDVMDYSAVSVGTLAFTKTDSFENNIMSSLFVINITNNTASSITVKCIKFKKLIPRNSNGSSPPKSEALILGYFLDNPITINAGNIGQVELTIQTIIDSGNTKIKLFNNAISSLAYAHDGVFHGTTKDLSGNTITPVNSFNSSDGAEFQFLNLIPVATGDLIANYNSSDYQITPNLTTTYTVTNTYDTNTNVRTLTYICTFTNSGGSDVNISCIKLKKSLNGSTESLMYGYYILDANGNQDYITVPAGGAKKYQFTITI